MARKKKLTQEMIDDISRGFDIGSKYGFKFGKAVRPDRVTLDSAGPRASWELRERSKGKTKEEAFDKVREFVDDIRYMFTGKR